VKQAERSASPLPQRGLKMHAIRLKMHAISLGAKHLRKLYPKQVAQLRDTPT